MSSARPSAPNLFQSDIEEHRFRQAPLAHRMRPLTLDGFVGQEHIIGPGRLLRRSIEADQLSSLILYGPPGTGKTTLASVIAQSSRSHFVTMNAVLAGVATLRREMEAAAERFEFHRQRTALFVDEVHRWNKAQQDALLPHVETGTIIFIGATTENPFFTVIKPLVSRSRVFQLKALQDRDIAQLLQRALADRDRGYGHRKIEMDPAARDHLVHMANGDARSALNALELAVATTPPSPYGTIHLTLAIAEESIQRRAVLYDRDGDTHYDAISAFIKSLRGSDPDAALYWGTRMIHAGEDPAFLFRRMAILASEDVGLADPHAVTVVDSCWSTYERIGMPEGMYPVAQAILYLATAPKSNSAMGIFEALKAVEAEKDTEVPTHLKDESRDAQAFGHGKGYRYPHAFTGHWVPQRYLPQGLEGRVFYEPGLLGYEGEMREAVLRRREEQLAADPGWEPFGREHVTFSPRHQGRENWLARAGQAPSHHLGELREAIFTRLSPGRHERMLILNADNGLLLWEACRRVPEGGVWGLASDASRESLARRAEALEAAERPHVIGTLDDLESSMPIEAFAGMNPCGAQDETRDLLGHLARVLPPEARGVCSQHLPLQGQRVHELVPLLGDLGQQLQRSEEALWRHSPDPARNWDESSLQAVMAAAGFNVEIELHHYTEQRFLPRRRVQGWFRSGSILGDRLRRAGVSARDLAHLADRYEQALGNQTVAWKLCTALICLRLPRE